ncbi:MAG: hypothetical protein LBG99_09320 [Propionibacteriaceae bacterium]|nr:hypothetical protein [Propionibacteriaceae bacterium]
MPAPTPQDVQPGVPIRSAPVSLQDYAGDREVSVGFQTAPIIDIRASASGIVTSLPLEPGAVVTSGTSPLSVDGRPVIALHTETPLYRDLVVGDRGLDALALQKELARLGFSVTATNTYSWQAAAAIQELRKRLGDSSTSGNLPLTDVLWIPAVSTEVRGVPITLGAAIESGDTLFTLGGQVTAIKVADVSRLDFRVGAMVMEWEDATAPIAPDGLVTDTAFLAVVSTSDAYRALLAETPDGSQPLGSAKVRLETPVTTLRVPPAAVFGIIGSQGCIQTTEGGALPVVIVASDLGGTLVQLPDDLPAPASVNIGAGVQDQVCE